MTTGAIRCDGDPLGRGDAVEPGHLDVEDDQVGAVLLGERDRGLAVAGLADDVVALLDEHLGEVHADQRLVLGDDDAAGPGLYGAHGSDRLVPGSAAPTATRAGPPRGASGVGRSDDARARVRARRGRRGRSAPRRARPAAATAAVLAPAGVAERDVLAAELAAETGAPGPCLAPHRLDHPRSSTSLVLVMTCWPAPEWPTLPAGVVKSHGPAGSGPQRFGYRLPAPGRVAGTGRQRRSQTPLSERACGFESHTRHSG